MSYIPIKNAPGQHHILSDEVSDVIGCWGWRLRPDGYLISRVPGQRPKEVRIGRMVWFIEKGEWPEKGMDVDHINHDPLDNRIENLRVVTRSVNNRNKKKREGTHSRYKWVQYHNRDKLFQGRANISDNGKRKEVTAGWTKDESLAALCGDCITHLIGGYLDPNFPDSSFNQKWDDLGNRHRMRIINSLKYNDITPVISVKGVN
jgi:hypothetical protein